MKKKNEPAVWQTCAIESDSATTNERQTHNKSTINEPKSRAPTANCMAFPSAPTANYSQFKTSYQKPFFFVSFISFFSGLLPLFALFVIYLVWTRVEFRYWILSLLFLRDDSDSWNSLVESMTVKNLKAGLVFVIDIPIGGKLYHFPFKLPKKHAIDHPINRSKRITLAADVNLCPLRIFTGIWVGKRNPKTVANCYVWIFISSIYTNDDRLRGRLSFPVKMFHLFALQIDFTSCDSSDEQRWNVNWNRKPDSFRVKTRHWASVLIAAIAQFRMGCCCGAIGSRLVRFVISQLAGASTFTDGANAIEYIFRSANTTQ